MDNRKDALVRWAKHCLEDMSGHGPVEGIIETVSGDASFRRYFRIRLVKPLESDEELVSPEINRCLKATQFLLVDAPPAHEDCRQFVSIANMFRKAGLTTPRVIEADYEQGFMLLQDFGDALYLPALERGEDVEALYGAAMDSLIALQADSDCSELPPYDKALLHRELSLFDDWFCHEFLGVSLDQQERELLDRTWASLEDAALSQPQVAVHRDYHSRNLMVRDESPALAPGVIDFQDAVVGANTYDLVSLLRDCYIVWPPEQVNAWALEFRSKAVAKGLLARGDSADEAAFLRDFDLMGLQRHIKVIGIFCRLYLRDGKQRYMADIPLVIDYVVTVAAKHPEMDEFLQWLQSKILPLANNKLATVISTQRPI
ncbi:MAG: aminoglycoside phosphotransferase family protein [Gammaproteobacteria bacterium]